MEHGTNASSLLKEVINNTGTKNNVLNINSLAGVMNFAKISQTQKTPRLPEDETDRFYFSILREQFREIKFHLRQVIQIRDAAMAGEVSSRNEKRLNLALMAMSKTIAGFKEDFLADFFKSLEDNDNESCRLFIIRTFTDSSNCHAAFFERLLTEELRNGKIDTWQIKKFKI